jgi:hypothetical protein
MIRTGLSRNLSLRQLLDLDPGTGEEKGLPVTTAGNTVQTVFQHVLKDDNPPERLVTLVIETLADHLEPGLWRQLEHMINRPMSLKLISALLFRRQIKNEEAERLRGKPEIASTGDEHALLESSE